MSYAGHPYGTRFREEDSDETFQYTEYEGYVYKVYDPPTDRQSVAVARIDRSASSNPAQRTTAAVSSRQPAQPSSSATRTGTNNREIQQTTRTDRLTRDLEVLSISPPSATQPQYRGDLRQASNRQPAYQEGADQASRRQPVYGDDGGQPPNRQAQYRDDRGPSSSRQAQYSTSQGQPRNSSDNVTSTRSPLTYAFGQVIEVPESKEGAENSSGVSTVRPPGHPSGRTTRIVRRYVIVDPPNAQRPYAIALRIRTHAHQGVPAEYPRSHFAVIYTANPIRAPAPDPTDAERQLRILPDGRLQLPMRASILVEEVDITQPLDPYSRLEYRDAVTIRPDPRIRYYGRVYPGHHTELRWNYQAMREGTLATGRDEPDPEALRFEIESDRTIQGEIIINYLAWLRRRARSRGRPAPPTVDAARVREMTRRYDGRRQFFAVVHRQIGL